MPADRPVRILDLGGTAAYWRALPGLYGRPGVEITVMNLGQKEEREGNLILTAGDACGTKLPDMAFDIVHSNSVIEHVGDWSRIQSMAEEVRRLAPCYFVQTPNYWFPIEPHYKLPALQFLPSSIAHAVSGIDHGEIRLLSKREVQKLFPDADVWREKFFGLTKSLVAIRTHTPT